MSCCRRTSSLLQATITVRCRWATVLLLGRMLLQYCVCAPAPALACCCAPSSPCNSALPPISIHPCQPAQVVDQIYDKEAAAAMGIDSVGQVSLAGRPGTSPLYLRPAHGQLPARLRPTPVVSAAPRNANCHNPSVLRATRSLPPVLCCPSVISSLRCCPSALLLPLLRSV